MNIENIKCFLTLSKTLNFTKAAFLENITQTAMSRKIAALESELNVTLFYRNNKEVSLTPSGIEFYNHALIIIEKYNNMKIDVQNVSSGLKNQLRIGIGAYEHLLLNQYISKFLKINKTLKISCLQFKYLELLNQIENDNLDIIFTSDQFLDKIDHRNYNKILINNNSWKLAINKKNPLSKFDLIDLDKLYNQTLITMHETSINQIKNYYNNFFKVKDIIYVNSFDSKLSLIDLNIGIGLLPSFIKIQQFQNIEIKKVNKNLILRNFYIMYKKNNRNKNLINLIKIIES